MLIGFVLGVISTYLASAIVALVLLKQFDFE